MWIFTNLYAQYALEGGCQQVMCGGLQTKWPQWHHMYFDHYMMNLNAHFKSQKRKALLIINKHVTHSLEHVGRGKSRVFSTLPLSNITIPFLPPNVWCNDWIMENLLHSKFNLRRSFWNGISLIYKSHTTRHDLRNMVHDVSKAIIRCSQAWKEMNPRIVWNN